MVKQNRSVLALCWRVNPDIKMHCAAEPVTFQAILHKTRANDGVICMAEVLFDQQESTMLQVDSGTSTHSMYDVTLSYGTAEQVPEPSSPCSADIYSNSISLRSG